MIKILTQQLPHHRIEVFKTESRLLSHYFSDCNSTFCMFFSTENDSLISAIEICREEIKVAYRKQCIKWHRDKNINIDTTQRMQDINQAYLILKDEEARSKYDIEYLKFKSYKSENINNNQYKYTKLSV